jgi:hypothetical protein
MRSGWQHDVKPGWNQFTREPWSRDPIVYTFIGKESQTTTVPPSGPIHDAGRVAPPALTASPVWRFVTTAGNEIVRRHLLSAEQVDHIKSSIALADQEHPGLERIGTVFRNALFRMQKAVESATWELLPIDEFLGAALSVVRIYLGFDITGHVASEALAAILLVQCTIPDGLTHPNAAPVESRILLTEHLANLCYDLVSARDQLDLEGYFETTYLAGLYAVTAMRIADWAKESGQHTQDELNRLENLTLNLDEIFAHQISPSFILPALGSQRDTLFWIMARARKEYNESDIAAYYQLYPPLRALLSDRAKPWWRSPQREVDEALRSASLSRGRFDAAEALTARGQFCPIPKEIRQTIAQDFFITASGRRRLGSGHDDNE